MTRGISCAVCPRFTQKCGLSELLSFKTTQQMPIVFSASYRTLDSSGRSGTSLEIFGVGIVKTTWAAAK